MLPEKRQTSVKLGLLLLICLTILASGCAIGTTTVTVSHDPLQQVPDKKKGDLLVNQFVDSRKPDHKNYIGNKRNGYGMVLGHIGLPDGVKLETLVTKYFAEALAEAGYNVAISASPVPGNKKFDAVIDGEITEFWLDLFLRIWQDVDVKITASDPTSKKKLWEKTIKGDKANTLWVGTTSEFEKVISEALTIALNKAAQEFASDEFYNAIKKK
jgi:hypothetical protein